MIASSSGVQSRNATWGQALPARFSHTPERRALAALQVLDGNNQVDKVVNLATTNYPEELDKRIVARPRRFDRILRIDEPDTRVRDAFFARKVPDLAAAERARWVALTDGLPFLSGADGKCAVEIFELLPM